MELYPWRFDSIHSHCHDDVISVLNILKEFWAYRGVWRTSGHVLKKQVRAGPRLTVSVDREESF
jgi:hypothetical protein